MANLFEIVLDEIKKILSEEDYRGEHSAPSADSAAPLYDATNAFGDDIYGPDAVRFFGTHSPYDGYSVSIIQSARNKPHKQVKIYRAVPKVITNQEKIIDYENRKKTILKTGRLPRDVTNWSNSSEYYDWLDDELERLKSEPETTEEKVRINNGDWVTINLQYAKEHGQRHLDNYRILTKTVTANQLFTDGNSIHEWGYNIG